MKYDINYYSKLTMNRIRYPDHLNVGLCTWMGHFISSNQWWTAAGVIFLVHCSETTYLNSTINSCQIHWNCK